MWTRLAVILAILWCAAGCPSEQEQNQEKWRALHERVRHPSTTPEQTPVNP